MSSIEYIKKALYKLDNDNLITFLLDVITCGGIEEVTDYDSTKQYRKDEKVYKQDDDGTHHIYVSTVDSPKVGVILSSEWVDLLQSFRRPIINATDVISTCEMIEETILCTMSNQTQFTITTPSVENKIYTINVYHPTKGRLAQTDWTLNGRIIKLNSGYEVPNIGDKLIIDLLKKN